MDTKELAERLNELPHPLKVVYPGPDGDIEVEVAGLVDGVVVLSNERETAGEVAPVEPPRVDVEQDLDDAVQRGQGLLILVHEAYALLGAARPVHWLLSGETGEATEWIRRQGILMSLIAEAGAAPPSRVPPEVVESLRKTIGVPPKE